MKQIEKALVRRLGLFRYIGFEFSEEENALTMTLRPSEEMEWHTEATTHIYIRPDGFYSEMLFYVDKEDATEEELLSFANKYNVGDGMVKLHVEDAEDAFAVIGTMPNMMSLDPEFSLDLSMSSEDADLFASSVEVSVFYLKGFMDTVIADFTGEEMVLDTAETA